MHRERIPPGTQFYQANAPNVAKPSIGTTMERPVSLPPNGMWRRNQATVMTRTASLQNVVATRTITTIYQWQQIRYPEQSPADSFDVRLARAAITRDYIPDRLDMQIANISRLRRTPEDQSPEPDPDTDPEMPGLVWSTSQSSLTSTGTPSSEGPDPDDHQDD